MGLKPDEVKRAMDPLRSFNLQLEEVEAYEPLKRGDLGEIDNLHGLGRTLVALRIALGLTQRQLAERLAVNESQVSRAERNEYQGITVDRLVRVRPHLDACFECLGHYHAAGDPRAVVIPPEPEEVITRECGQPVLASSAADLGIVAGLGVRQVLSDGNSTQSDNQWVWTSEGIPNHPDLGSPFSRLSASLTPHPTCAICGGGVPRRVLLSSQIRQSRHGGPGSSPRTERDRRNSCGPARR